MIISEQDFLNIKSTYRTITASDLSKTNLVEDFGVSVRATHSPGDIFIKQSLMPVFSEHVKVMSPLERAARNAIRHGNRNNPEKPLHVRTEWLRSRKVCISITDSGEGFNAAEIHTQFQNGERYYKHSGRGWREYHYSPHLITFDQDGSTILILAETQWDLSMTNVNDLEIKGSRLRPPGIYNGVKTHDVNKLAAFLREHPHLDLAPSSIYRQPNGKGLLLEGRHRFLAYVMAGRQRILTATLNDKVAAEKMYYQNTNPNYAGGHLMSGQEFKQAVAETYPEYGIV